MMFNKSENSEVPTNGTEEKLNFFRKSNFEILNHYKIIPILLITILITGTAFGNKPNVVFMLTDDQGWTDLSGFNEYSSKFYNTPALERLAKNGVTFNKAYAEPVCAPTRADLLTGFYPTRHHMYTVTYKKDSPETQLGRRENNPSLPVEFTTLADVLKENGYTCAQLGKWHLGQAGSERGPKARGFDITYGGSNQGAPRGGEGSKTGPPAAEKGGCYWAGKDGKFHYLSNLPENGKSGQYLTDRLTEDTVKVMQQIKDKPFFVYLGHYGVHGPFQSLESDQKEYLVRKEDPNHPRHKNVVYAGMITSIDRSVETIISYLEQTADPRNPGKKLIENTLFIFMSDNGGNGAATAQAPLRTGKSYPHEGGVRVPLIIRWKDYKHSCDTAVHAVDFFQTIAEVCEVTDIPKTDGLSILPLIRNDGDFPERAFFRHQPVHIKGGPSSTITKGDYKLMYYYNTPDSTEYKGYGYYELYNLKDDIGESKNLAASVDLSKKNPAKGIIEERIQTVFRNLSKELNQWLTETEAALPYIKGTSETVKLPKI